MTNLAVARNDSARLVVNPDVAREIIREKSFKVGKEFVLSSGRKSTIYFQMKYAMLDAAGSYYLASMALQKLHELDCNAVGGLEMGAVPIISSMATVSFINGSPVQSFFIRKAAKEHGTKELVEGTTVGELMKSRVAVVDDVTTTGGSGLIAVRVLRDLGIRVRHAITIVDREEGATEAFAKEGISLHSLFRKSEFATESAPAP